MTINKVENEQAVRDALRLACERAGGQKAWAIANGVSMSLVCETLRNGRPVSARVAGLVGFDRVMVFRLRGESIWKKLTNISRRG